MQPSEDRQREHFAILRTRRLTGRGGRSLLADRSMQPPPVEVGDVFGQHATQMAFTEDKGVIQALLPDRSHPSFSDRIGLWCSKWGTNLSDSEVLEPSIEERTVAAVAIVDREAWWLTVPATAFHDLLRNPLCRGMLGDLDMRHFTAGVADHEEGMEGLGHKVWMQKKSQAQISAACRSRKVRQLGDGSRACARRMYWQRFGPRP
jgi:hypothetical protein